MAADRLRVQARMRMPIALVSVVRLVMMRGIAVRGVSGFGQGLGVQFGPLCVRPCVVLVMRRLREGALPVLG